MKKFGFTLAEVLITLVIIGIIAAITIPALINNTNKTENVVAYKKALSVVNQALNTEYSLEGNTAGYTAQPISGLPKFAENWRGLPAIMAKRTNIIKHDIDKNYSTECSTLGAEWVNTRAFVTSDGLLFCINEPTNAWPVCPENMNGCASGLVDVNGVKGPNKVLTIRWDAKRKENVFVVEDIFRFDIHDKEVRPGNIYEKKILQGYKYR